MKKIGAQDTNVEQRNVSDQQTRLGSTPGLIVQLISLALDDDSDLKPHATRALGDLICNHRSNILLFQRQSGALNKLVNSALTSSRFSNAQSCAYTWACLVMRSEIKVGLVGHAVAPPPDQVDDPVGVICQTLVESARIIIGLRDKIYVDPSALANARQGLFCLREWFFLLYCKLLKKNLFEQQLCGVRVECLRVYWIKMALRGSLLCV